MNIFHSAVPVNYNFESRLRKLNKVELCEQEGIH